MGGENNLHPLSSGPLLQQIEKSHLGGGEQGHVELVDQEKATPVLLAHGVGEPLKGDEGAQYLSKVVLPGGVGEVVVGGGVDEKGLLLAVLRHPDNIGGFFLVDHNASVPLVKALDLAFRKVRLLGLRVKELADRVGPFQAEIDYGVVNVALALGSGGAGHDTNGRFVFCGTLKRFDLDVLPLGSGNGLVAEIDVIEMLTRDIVLG